MKSGSRYNPWQLLKIGGMALLSLFIVSSVVYYLLGQYYYSEGLIEKPWTVMDCVFMVSITLSTIGYGDWLGIRNLTMAEIYTMFLALAGIGVPAFIISTGTALLVEGVISDTFRKRRMQQEISSLSNHIIICGGGITGQHCIEEMIKIGQKFVVVDSNEDRLRELIEEIGVFPYVAGHADRDEVLQAAGIARASGLLCCLREDKDNLFITLTARVLNPELRIVSKGVEDHVRRKMVMAGANSIVNPTAIGGLRMVSELLRPATTSFLDSMLRDRTATRFGELVVGKDAPLCGKTLAEADLRHRADVLIVAARHPGQESFIYNPKADFLLEASCVVVVLGAVGEIEKLRPMFSGPATVKA
jgi:voltage-gated potassium channel